MIKILLAVLMIIPNSGIQNGFADSIPEFSFPKPTGSYAVGTRFFYLIDKNRPDIFSSEPNKYREISLEVWYPAEPKENEKPFPYSARETYPLVESGVFSLSFINEFALRPTHSYLNAPLARARRPFPVVLYSSSGVMTANTFLFEKLASHGYIVFTIGHPYWCEFYFDAEGKIIPGDKNNEHYKELWKEENSQIVNDLKEKITRATNAREKLDLHQKLNQHMPEEIKDVRLWAEDIGFVIEELKRMDSGSRFFKGKLDMKRIGIMGYSKGGVASGQFCATDNRCKAGINLSGFMFGDVVKQNIKQPFMIMEGVEPWCQNCLPINDLFFHQAESSVYMVQIKNALHGNFTDVSLMEAGGFLKVKGVVGAIDGNRFLEIQNNYVLEFFNKYVRGLPVQFLDGPSSKYPEVLFKVRIRKNE